MDDDTVAALDALAAKRNTTRSELVREAVAALLAGTKRTKP